MHFGNSPVASSPELSPRSPTGARQFYGTEEFGNSGDNLNGSAWSINKSEASYFPASLKESAGSSSYLNEKTYPPALAVKSSKRKRWSAKRWLVVAVLGAVGALKHDLTLLWVGVYDDLP